ncbi:hypothetical protein RYX36_034665 [Vicia faba]
MWIMGDDYLADYLSSNLPFFEKFPDDYNALQSKMPLVLIGMKNKLLLKVLMLDNVDLKRRDYAEKEMAGKLNKYKDGYTKSQNLLKALQKDKDTWEKNLAVFETKSTKIASKEKSRRMSFEEAIRSKKELKKEVSNLTNELVSTSGVYFEHVRE